MQLFYISHLLIAHKLSTSRPFVCPNLRFFFAINCMQRPGQLMHAQNDLVSYKNMSLYRYFIAKNIIVFVLANFRFNWCLYALHIAIELCEKRDMAKVKVRFAF